MPKIKKRPSGNRQKPTITHGPSPGIINIDSAKVIEMAKEFRDAPETIDIHPVIQIRLAFKPEGLFELQLYLDDGGDEAGPLNSCAVDNENLSGDSFVTTVRAMIAQIQSRRLARIAAIRASALNKLTCEEQIALGL